MTVANGDEVIDNPHPHDMASAIKVTSAGNSVMPPNKDPKKIAIMMGENPNALNAHNAMGKPDKSTQSGIE